MKPTAHHITTLLLLIILCGCGSAPDHPTESRELPPIVPDYVGVTIPQEIAPLNFGIEGADRLDVTIRGAKSGELHTNGDYADFNIDEWHNLVRQNVGDSLVITVCARYDGSWTQYRPFAVYISSDPLDEWGITYRLIPPGYESYRLMGIYQRDLSSFDETAIIDNRDIDKQCINCHTPNRTNPNAFTFHVRGEHGATVVSHNGVTEILEPRNGQLGGGMVYPFWHPSGHFIAYSTNQTHQNFHQLKDLRVEVYDEKSDIIIYRTDTHEIYLDSLLATKDHLENYPVFSPDGRTLYFCAAEKQDSIWKNFRHVKYNICRIGFNQDTGQFEGKVDTLINARSLGKSANMPRISYDGRFLLYTLSDYGCFPIWHPEADLWMMNLEDKTTRPLDEANSPDADSFHNWSLNSRWIVFTSRRADGLYTKLYLAHIDSTGHAAKAFRLPQRNPQEYDAETIWSFNTPDFAAAPFGADRAELARQLMSPQRIPTTFQTTKTK